MGSAELAAPLAGRLAEAAGGWSLVPDYRLAPEYPFPAALDDVLAAYRWLARQYPRAPILVSGECAGEKPTAPWRSSLPSRRRCARISSDHGRRGEFTRAMRLIHEVHDAPEANVSGVYLEAPPLAPLTWKLFFTWNLFLLCGRDRGLSRGNTPRTAASSPQNRTNRRS
jgi:hypothetical protein